MTVTRKIQHKNEDGTVTEAEIGCLAANVATDSSHRFVTDAERQKWNSGLKTVEITLTAAGWTGDAAPYVQTVEMPEATEAAEAFLVSALPADADAAAQKVYQKTFALVAAGTAELGAGTATFRVYEKPQMDIKVGLRGEF